MEIRGNTVIFGACDRNFLERFGFLRASNMVLDYHTEHPMLPFLYDADQLAEFLGTDRGALNHFAHQLSNEYRTIVVPKKNGTPRQLSVPSFRLKSFQVKINRCILSQLPVSKYAAAYRSGTSIRQNAEPHVGKKFLLKLDITDFFGSITFEQIYRAAFNTRYVSREVGYLLTMLCSKNGVLPQGAPTSPALSNIVMHRFDDYIGHWCGQHRAAYTRYCDDMTFSSDSPLYTVYQKVKELLLEMGFELNETKTHFAGRAHRQSVTGLTVNEKLAVSVDYKRRLRQEVYYALKYGVGESIRGGDHLDFVKEEQPEERRYLSHLLGKVQYVLQIEPENRWFCEAKQKLLSYERKLCEGAIEEGR